MGRLTESIVEDAAPARPEGLGYAVLHGPDISPAGDTLTPALSRREREDCSQVVLEGRLRQALVRLNPDLPAEALEDAFHRYSAPSTTQSRTFDRLGGKITLDFPRGAAHRESTLAGC